MAARVTAKRSANKWQIDLRCVLLPCLRENPGAQASRPGANPSLAQAERNAVELKQGMTLEEVQKLLGKPKRTALRSSAGEPWRRQVAGAVVRE